MKPKIITEADEYFVIDKPAMYSVEPHRTIPSIYDWLKDDYGFKPITELERGGVVHRLDVETSGVMIWAKTAAAQEKLRQLWQGRAVKKNYLALVAGEAPASGQIELPISRDTKNDRMKAGLLASTNDRAALTTYKRIAVGECDGRKICLLEAHPVTGRTHQIRVHLKAIGHPIIGDKLYGDKTSTKLASQLGLTRQFLHASKIEIPNQGVYESPLTAELQAAMSATGLAHDRPNQA
jgi:23S rRNA pseudouridine1911/1915/1917 synthase